MEDVIYILVGIVFYIVVLLVALSITSDRSSKKKS